MTSQKGEQTLIPEPHAHPRGSTRAVQAIFADSHVRRLAKHTGDDASGHESDTDDDAPGRVRVQAAGSGMDVAVRDGRQIPTRPGRQPGCGSDLTLARNECSLPHGVTARPIWLTAELCVWSGAIVRDCSPFDHILSNCMAGSNRGVLSAPFAARFFGAAAERR